MIFSPTRSFAERERGLLIISNSEGLIGFLVIKNSSEDLLFGKPTLDKLGYASDKTHIELRCHARPVGRPVLDLRTGPPYRVPDPRIGPTDRAPDADPWFGRPVFVPVLGLVGRSGPTWSVRSPGQAW